MEPNVQPDQQQDNVWISREEYERLRQQAQQAPAQAPLQPLASSASYQVADEPPAVKPIQMTIGALLAVGLLLSFTVPFFKAIAAPILIVMLIFAVMSLNDFRRAKQQAIGPAGQPAVTGSSLAQKPNTRKYKTLLIVLLCILAAPVVLIAGFIVLMIVIFSVGGGPSS